MSFASSSAVVGALMEKYSVGHLLNLQSGLGKLTTKLVDKIENRFNDAAAKKFATNMTYTLANCMSDGISGAEEGMSTEIINLFTDRLISKDKSKIELAANEYRKQGLSDDEISKHLFEDFSAMVVL